ncbi:chromosome partitioning protein ParA [Croceicoccus estronivorus]|uniref:Mrp/NBP35 family ATP-binding protein n=1 Tax=Croceicoccus estronivorus TaxID=1172626 RepID=UPI00082C1BC6|nr:Mrp/NBP35 family ATP-binding protein [Croceicoccus estronivorus]OCC22878.1 chromosome partitioning protein ParA [Croceicoccus estronivorus]
MNEAELKAKLPPAVAGRLQSLRLIDDTATLVLDASGLDRADAAALEESARQAVTGSGGPREVRIAMMADKVKRRIIAVASGKGGVGKSTLTTNLAVALARLGHKVGLVDADIYGPSQPRLLANEGERPEAVDKKLIPVPSACGVPVLSMGHLAKPGQAIAWRGPMASNALGQLIDADWGAVETLLVDMPPGTGDIQLTMMQRYRPDGVVIVSTPQDLALIDATRAIHLFEQVDVPVIGLVENMAGYLCPHCGKGSDPFGHGGAEQAAAEMGLPFLGRVPLALEIREASDAGTPPAAGDGPQAESFVAIAGKLAAWLAGQDN